MKKLIGKLCLLFALLLLGFVLLAWLSTKSFSAGFINRLTKSEDYANQLMASNEVEAVLEKARTQDESTKLIIGDSVCNAIFGELQSVNPQYSMLCSNKGVTMAGQYILAHEYLENHPEATDVYLLLITNSMITGFDTEFGYQYAVMPFVKTDTISLLDEGTIQDMKDVYFSPFVTKAGVLLVEQSAMVKKLYLNALKKYKPNPYKLEFSELTTSHILKIEALCKERGVTMHFLALPVADTEERREIEKTLKQRYEESDLYASFPKFYDGFLYYPAEQFPDGMHPEANRALRDDMIHAIEEINEIDFNLNYIDDNITREEEK